ncbi:hypothetical protein EVAR_6004_1 [Eumeta japonica]|uniref:Uncharacterized protein n=1 Tax=Eumeta variegata TaxID=151549 RepID=A0A4C1TAJ5_EUMVA|nr:hypothetical protein EVAR_6004_1 [Eumeta japonica]
MRAGRSDCVSGERGGVFHHSGMSYFLTFPRSPNAKGARTLKANGYRGFGHCLFTRPAHNNSGRRRISGCVYVSFDTLIYKRTQLPRRSVPWQV